MHKYESVKTQRCKINLNVLKFNMIQFENTCEKKEIVTGLDKCTKLFIIVNKHKFRNKKHLKSIRTYLARCAEYSNLEKLTYIYYREFFFICYIYLCLFFALSFWFN